MKEKKKLLTDAFILGLTSCILGLFGIWFNIFLTSAMGTEGIGLFQLISSVYTLAATFATSGINLSVTRVISESLSLESTKSSVPKQTVKCFAVCAVLGFGASFLLFSFSDIIAERILFRPYTAECFRILAWGLPFMSVGSGFNGFFVAERKAYKTAVSNGIEELMKIGVAVVLFLFMPPSNIIDGCKKLVLGLVLGELVSCVVSFFMWAYDVKRMPRDSSSSKGTVSKMFSIGAPVATSSYLRTGLTTIENLSVPLGLEKSGMLRGEALSVFGAVKSLAVPVIFFPASFMYAFIKVMIPEVTKAYTLCDRNKIREDGEKIIRITLILSSLISGIFIVFYRDLGMLLFKDENIGVLLLYLAPLIPAMYVDGVVDGILKGINEQVAVMRYNIYEAAIRLVIVFTLIPLFGFWGFMITVYAGNVINTTFSLMRLHKKAGIKIYPFQSVLLPFFVCTAFGYMIKSFLSFIDAPVAVILKIALTVICWISFFPLCIKTKKREYLNGVRKVF